MYLKTDFHNEFEWYTLTYVIIQIRYLADEKLGAQRV